MDIYLDQNQWIPLARAFHGRESDPVIKQVALLASSAVTSGRARFPISRLHLIEATKTTDEAQRRRLIEAFLHFGRGWIVRPAELLHAEELLNWSRGGAPRASSAIGRGLLASFSDHAAAARELGVSSREVEETDRFGDSPEAWHLALTGPGFRALATKIQAIARKYAAQVESVRAQWAQLPPPKRKAVFAEGLLQDTIESLHPVSPELRPVFDKLSTVAPDQLLAIIAGIPTMDVLFVLSERKTRDLSRPTDPNDLWDLAFLAPTIPYCQVVVTEKYWSHIAKATKLDAKYSCRVLARLEELVPLLQGDTDFRSPGAGIISAQTERKGTPITGEPSGRRDG